MINMELTEPDILLLKFLARYAVADIQCIRTIYKSHDNERYYQDRITKLKDKGNKYITLKNNKSTYALLKNGRQAVIDMGIHEIAWYSGKKVCLSRLESVSKTAVLLMQAGADVLSGSLEGSTAGMVFVPSNIIKKRINGIDMQSRFAGILFCSHDNFAVYDLGDGSRIWQPMSESTLFKEDLRDGWKLDGMLLLTDDGSLTNTAARVCITDISENKNRVRKRTLNPIRLWPGFKRCCLAKKSEARITVKLLSTPDLTCRIINDMFEGAQVLNGSIGEADCIYKGIHIYLFLDNDLLRIHLIKQFFEAYPEESPKAKPTQVYCFETYYRLVADILPEARVIPIKAEKIERILQKDGGNLC